MRTPIASSLLLLAACATVPVGGARRNPAFTEEKAPPPTLALELLACDASGVPSRAPPVPGAAEALFRALHAARTPVDEPSRERLCAALSADRALFADLVRGADWTVGAEVAPLLRRLAEDGGAGSVLVSLTRTHGSCRPKDAFFRDGAEPPPGRVPTGAACGEDARVDVGLLLFSASGALLWSSSGTAETPAPSSVLPVLERAATGVPAELAPPG